MISRWYARQEWKLISFNNFINTQCCKFSVSFVYSNITTPCSTSLLNTPMTVKFLLLLLRGLTVFDCGSENVTFFFPFLNHFCQNLIYAVSIYKLYFTLLKEARSSMNGQVYCQTSASVPDLNFICIFCQHNWRHWPAVTDYSSATISTTEELKDN